MVVNNTIRKCLLFFTLVCPSCGGLMPTSAAASEDSDESAVDVIVNASGSPSVFETLPYLVGVVISNETPVTDALAEIDWAAISDDQRRIVSQRVAISHMEIPAHFVLGEEHASPFALTVVDANGNVVIEPETPGMDAFYLTHEWQHSFSVGPEGRPLPASLSDFQRRSVDAGSSQSVAFVIDATSQVADLVPGEYAMIVAVFGVHECFGVISDSWRSPRIQFSVHQLTAAERHVIDQIVPHTVDENAAVAGSRDWLSPDVDRTTLKNELSPQVMEQVSFALLVGQAAAIESADNLSQDLINALPEHLRPMADVVRYELLLND